MNNMPTVTKNLLIINVLCFFGAIVAQKYGIYLNNLCGMHFFLSPDFNIVQLVTYIFLHANFEHIFFNMFAVWMFGRTLELIWGPKRFLIYYMVCGIGAAIVQELITTAEYFTLTSSLAPEAVEMVLREGSSVYYSGMNYVDPNMAELNVLLNRSTIGASGAVYGILLAFGMLFPNSQMFVFPIPFPIKAKFFVVGYAVIELVLGISRTADGVAHFAHLGGMIFGFLLLMYWKKKRNNGQYYN